MPRRFARENFTSGRRRRPISSSMLKVPIHLPLRFGCVLVVTLSHCDLKGLRDALGTAMTGMCGFE